MVFNKRHGERITLIFLLLAILMNIPQTATWALFGNSECKKVKKEILKEELNSRGYWEKMNKLRTKILSKNLMITEYDFVSFTNAVAPILESDIKASLMASNNSKCFSQSKLELVVKERASKREDLKNVQSIISDYMKAKSENDKYQLTWYKQQIDDRNKKIIETYYRDFVGLYVKYKL